MIFFELILKELICIFLILFQFSNLNLINKFKMSNLLQRRGNSIYLRIREYMMKNISINIIIIFLVF
jgi:hypothetical protein